MEEKRTGSAVTRIVAYSYNNNGMKQRLYRMRFVFQGTAVPDIKLLSSALDLLPCELCDMGFKRP